MIIRSITYTIDFDKLEFNKYLTLVKNRIEEMVFSYEKNEQAVRTIRFNTVFLNDSLLNDSELFFKRLGLLSDFSKTIGIRWFNISFNLNKENKKNIRDICNYSYRIIKEFDNSFINILVAQEYINNYSVKKASKLIKNVSLLSSNGIDNFRLGVSLNIKANTPFFPFSYSDKIDSFSIALETTRYIIDIVDNYNGSDYIKLKKIIITATQNYIQNIESIAEKIAINNDIIFNGQDLSLSPYPDENVSVINLLNKLGVDDFGSNGTQFMTSYLTSVLKELIFISGIKTVGFNGVMYSLLEDKLMCKSHNNGNFSIDSIILYSTVCGCGLDMVPLPGDVKEEEIASMILDVATTAIKLDKPLGVRVLPIPNKFSSDMTDFKLDFLTNTKIPVIKNIHINKSLFNIEEFYVNHSID
jgi:uncharacterized protein